MTALMKSPYANLLLFAVKNRALKSCLPKIAAINGVSRSLTSAVTTAVNAVPMTTATARSTTLPRKMNSLNPLSTSHLRRPPASDSPPMAEMLGRRADRREDLRALVCRDLHGHVATCCDEQLHGSRPAEAAGRGMHR